jgi:hypothetical protein
VVQVAACLCGVAGELVRECDAEPLDARVGAQAQHVEARVDEGVVLAGVGLEDGGLADDVEVVLWASERGSGGGRGGTLSILRAME